MGPTVSVSMACESAKTLGHDPIFGPQDRLLEASLCQVQASSCSFQDPHYVWFFVSCFLRVPWTFCAPPLSQVSAWRTSSQEPELPEPPEPSEPAAPEEAPAAPEEAEEAEDFASVASSEGRPPQIEEGRPLGGKCSDLEHKLTPKTPRLNASGPSTRTFWRKALCNWSKPFQRVHSSKAGCQTRAMGGSLRLVGQPLISSHGATAKV